MRLAVIRIFLTIFLFCVLGPAAVAQDVTRELKVSAGGVVEITNLSGRVSVKAEKASEEAPVIGRLTATSSKGVSDPDVRIIDSGSRTVITVTRSDVEKRIDITVIL